MLLELSVSQLSPGWIRAEPQFVVLPVLACVWLPFAIGLWFDRRWAWIGSFVLSFISALYVALASVTWRPNLSWLECLLWVVPAALVIAALLHTRHHFLRASYGKPG